MESPGGSRQGMTEGRRLSGWSVGYTPQKYGEDNAVLDRGGDWIWQ